MKEAIKVKNSLITLLNEAADGRFRVVGIAERKTDVENLLDCPEVVVEYESGRFAEGMSSINGPYQHEGTINIAIKAAAVSEMDLAPLIKGGTPEEMLEAWAGRESAYTKSDKIIDDTVWLIFDLIMRPQNEKLGLTYNPARWISEIRKGPSSDIGDIVVRVGVMTLKFQVPEYTTEEVGIPGTSIVQQTGITPDIHGEFTEEEAVRVTTIPNNT